MMVRDLCLVMRDADTRRLSAVVALCLFLWLASYGANLLCYTSGMLDACKIQNKLSILRDCFTFLEEQHAISQGGRRFNSMALSPTSLAFVHHATCCVVASF